MKSAGSYISSFIVSVILVFTLIGSAALAVADSFATPDRLIKLTEDKKISSLVYSELEKYFSEKYASTGIPSDVYMNAVDEDYLQSVINSRIEYGFSNLSDKYANLAPENNSNPSANPELENNITDFFKDYAQSINYEIQGENDKYYVKLKSAKLNAISSIEEYCDVFKFTALTKHGVTAKIRPIYSRLPFLKIICIGASAFLALILVVCNFQRFKDILYWLGVSSFSAGVLGGIPCIYLISTDYFSAFTIKQPQIYTAYTSSMRICTNNFLTACCILAGISVLLFILYGIISAISRNRQETE